MKIIKPAVYLEVIAIVIVISGLIYAAVQQSCSSSSNYLQLQIADELSEYLKAAIPLIIL